MREHANKWRELIALVLDEAATAPRSVLAIGMCASARYTKERTECSHGALGTFNGDTLWNRLGTYAERQRVPTSSQSHASHHSCGRAQTGAHCSQSSDRCNCSYSSGLWYDCGLLSVCQVAAGSFLWS
jgi:hypothetical protein